MWTADFTLTADQECWTADALNGCLLSQPRFRWRNDDGTETTATWAAAENTNITSPLG
jgi:hypothetical protein